jgi:hypothetical protein
MIFVCRTFLLILILSFGITHAQDRDAVREHLLGAWKMDERILRSPGFVSYQEDATITFTSVLPDGRLQVIARITTRAVGKKNVFLMTLQRVCVRYLAILCISTGSIRAGSTTSSNFPETK